MTVAFPYDLTKNPPAPVLPVRVGTAGGSWSAVAASLVDTGADLSVIPVQVAKELKLSPVGEIAVQGVTGVKVRVLLYRAEFDIAGVRLSTRVAGFGREVIIGRDVINRWTLVLRGPEKSLELEAPSSAGG